MSGPFKDSSVIITGASSGIGKELARELATQGARLSLAARDAARLEEVAASCRAQGAAALAIPTDVGDEAQCRALVERSVAELGRIDMLVCNAGISMWARFDELRSVEPLERIMRINYFGSVYCAFHALPHIKASRGRIVGVSSVTGKAGIPTRSGYAASKHAMAGFFDSLRIELRGSGVSVTMIYPDFVATEVRERMLGPDGRPMASAPPWEPGVMSAADCARIVIEAAALRRREIVTSRRARLGLWLKLLAPELLDRMAERAIARARAAGR